MLIDPGLYCRFAERPSSSQWAVFLDRDGVIVEETNYLHLVADIAMIEPAAAAVRQLNEAAVPAVLVTNQAGIARGYYPWADFETVQQEIEARLGDARLDAVLACGYHPDGTGPLAHDHPFRKPNPGMLEYAAAKMGLHLSQCWMVGDKIIDLEAGIRAGLAGVILVRTGYGRGVESEVATLEAGPTKIFVADHVFDAVEIILRSRPL